MVVRVSELQSWLAARTRQSLNNKVIGRGWEIILAPIGWIFVASALVRLLWVLLVAKWGLQHAGKPRSIIGCLLKCNYRLSSQAYGIGWRYFAIKTFI
ncbi:hypothetical protein XELAEV_18004450mg [Xenopus laevis]|uniref:Uncharacterized protein n=1 Tax=Xenopus laevis TaxID=8355 RepID=A0A974GZP7_XENLA|nr:hypothetical protein XELAEV_18004450mg [Xenopus laevis]